MRQGQPANFNATPPTLTDGDYSALSVDVNQNLRTTTVGGAFGTLITPSNNFTRPADTTTYASGDLVANSTTAGSVVPLSWTAARVATGNFFIRRIRLTTSSTSVTLSNFRVHFYTTLPTVTNGDNGAWLSPTSGWIGAMDVTVNEAFSDGAAGNGSPNIGSELGVALASGQLIYGLIEARAAYVPTSGEVFTVILEVYQS